jgi:hypothetical protein
VRPQLQQLLQRFISLVQSDKSSDKSIEKTQKAFNGVLHGLLRETLEGKTQVIQALLPWVEQLVPHQACYVFVVIGACVEGGADGRAATAALMRLYEKVLVENNSMILQLIKIRTDHDDSTLFDALYQLEQENPPEFDKFFVAFTTLEFLYPAVVTFLMSYRESLHHYRAQETLMNHLRKYNLSKTVIPVLLSYPYEALLICEDEPLWVLIPSSKQGYRLHLQDIQNNQQWLGALEQHIIPAPRYGNTEEQNKLLFLTDQNAAPKTTEHFKMYHFCFSWHALKANGTVDETNSEREMLPNDVPAEIPLFDGKRVALLRMQPVFEEWPIMLPFINVNPRVTIEPMAAEEVTALLQQIVQAKQTEGG